MGSMFSSRIDPEKDLVDLRGKVAIVTGGSSGIGVTTIQFLARRGAKVYMAARNESRATGAIAQLEHEGLGYLGGTVGWLNLDLSNPRFAKRAAEVFLGKEDRLGVLAPYKLTEDGVTEQMITNHVSPFVFTETLLPLMKATAAEPGSDVRIVNVSSIAHNQPPPVLSFKGKDTLNAEYDGNTKRYGLSKLANILHIKELQRRLVPITCLALHPGTVATPGCIAFLRTTGLPQFFIDLLAKVVLSSMVDGAMTSAVAAAGVSVARDRQRYRGAYLVPVGKIGRARSEADDVRLAKELWDTTEGIVESL